LCFVICVFRIIDASYALHNGSTLVFSNAAGQDFCLVVSLITYTFELCIQFWTVCLSLFVCITIMKEKRLNLGRGMWKVHLITWPAPLIIGIFLSIWYGVVYDEKLGNGMMCWFNRTVSDASIPTEIAFLEFAAIFLVFCSAVFFIVAGIKLRSVFKNTPDSHDNSNLKEIYKNLIGFAVTFWVICTIAVTCVFYMWLTNDVSQSTKMTLSTVAMSAMALEGFFFAMFYFVMYYKALYRKEILSKEHTLASENTNYSSFQNTTVEPKSVDDVENDSQPTVTTLPSLGGMELPKKDGSPKV